MYESKLHGLQRMVRCRCRVCYIVLTRLSRDLMKLSSPGASEASPLCHSNAVSLSEWTPEDSQGRLERDYSQVHTKIVIDFTLTNHTSTCWDLHTHRYLEEKELTKGSSQQWNKSHLPVTYPFTRSACKVDEFLFFQSGCRFSHF